MASAIKPDLQAIEMNSVTSIQPITALSFLQLPSLPSPSTSSVEHITSSLLLSGEGTYVKIFSTATGRLLQKRKIFSKDRIHGIYVERMTSPQLEGGEEEEVDEDDSGFGDTAFEGLNSVLVLFWGSRKLVATRLGDLLGDEDQNIVESALDGCSGSALPTLTELTAKDWIQSAIIIPKPLSQRQYQGHNVPEKDYIIAAITAHNSVLYFDIAMRKLIGEAKFSEKCILYSAAIVYIPAESCQGESDKVESGASVGRVLVAAGTVFGDILVWSTIVQSTDLNIGEEPREHSVDPCPDKSPESLATLMCRGKSEESEHRRLNLLGDSECWERVDDDETWDKIEAKPMDNSGKEGHTNVKKLCATSNYLQLHYRLKGHEGSIFGVNISPRYFISPKSKSARFLASCSDDRTVRVWDISQCDNSGLGDGSESPNPKELSEWDDASMEASVISASTTGFSQSDAIPSASAFEKDPGPAHQVATGWGHGARIWHVRFLKNRPTEDGIHLISVSEDLTSKLWTFNPNTKKQLACLETIQMHSGKNIWSMAVDEHWGLLATGGADSRVAIVEYGGSGIERKVWGFEEVLPPRISSTLDRSLKRLALPETKADADRDGFRSYTVVDKHRILVGSNHGHLLTFTFPYASARFPQGGVAGSGLWRLLGHWPRLKSYAAVAAWESTGLICVGDSDGHIGIIDLNVPDNVGVGGPIGRWWKAHQGSIGGLFCGHQGDLFHLISYSLREKAVHLHLFPNPRKPQKPLSFDTDNCPPRLLKTIVLMPPDGFQIVTSIYLDFTHGLLYLGSRNGVLAVFDVFSGAEEGIILQPLENWRRYHDKDAITHIIGYPNSFDGPKADSKQDTGSSEKRVSRVLTAGRNGVYAILDLEIFSSPTASTKKIHRSTLHAKKLFTTHSSADGGGTGSPIIEGAYINGQDLILYGFRGRCFFVWNETMGYEILSEDCGGPKRSWCFYEAGKQVGEVRVGWLAWTRAGKMHTLRMDRPQRRVIQPGHHGREIKTMAISKPPIDFTYPYHPHSSIRILATGAEDTTIRLSCLHAIAGNPSLEVPDTPTKLYKLSTIATFKKHSTGIQHLVWSSCGGWLFSSGGVEEFYVWRVKRLNGTQYSGPLALGVKCEAACPIHSVIPDLRIMGFDVTTVNVDNRMNERAFLITMVYSDSSIKVWLYDPYKRSFQLLISGKYKASCLMHVKHHIYNFPEAKSTADVPPLFLLFVSGTDGHLCVYDITQSLANKRITATRSGLKGDRDLLSENRPIKILKSCPDWTFQAHQSGVKSMEVIPARNKSDGPILIVTGGDDCGISATFLEVRVVPMPLSLKEAGDRLLQYRQFGTATVALEGYWEQKRIEGAHASAVTTVVPVSRRYTESSKVTSVVLVTSGVDQVVSKWQVILTRATLPDHESNPSNYTMPSNSDIMNVNIFSMPEDTRTRRSLTRFTSVADIACGGILGEEIVMDQKRGEYVEDTKVVLAGVGIDIWNVKVPIEGG